MIRALLVDDQPQVLETGVRHSIEVELDLDLDAEPDIPIELKEALYRIAQELSIGNRTVKSHISSILAKLGVQSRTQAALHAAPIGLVDTAEVGG